LKTNQEEWFITLENYMTVSILLTLKVHHWKYKFYFTAAGFIHSWHSMIHLLQQLIQKWHRPVSVWKLWQTSSLDSPIAVAKLKLKPLVKTMVCVLFTQQQSCHDNVSTTSIAGGHW